MFFQKDRQFLDWFQVLIHLTGKQGWINWNKISCSIHYNDSTQIQGKHHKNRIVKYKGLVWCINTKYGNFIAKRNGKIFITGNSGFPKSHNISKAIDKAKGVKRKVVGKKMLDKGICKGNMHAGRQTKMVECDNDVATSQSAKLWDGWGTGLKPAFEPIIVAMKPLDGTYAHNAEKWCVAGLNIDGGRVTMQKDDFEAYKKLIRSFGRSRKDQTVYKGNALLKSKTKHINKVQTKGRWPANIILDEESGRMLDKQSGNRISSGVYKKKGKWTNPKIGKIRTWDVTYDKLNTYAGQTGGASRFFYTAKASKKERNLGLHSLPNTHPTVKPLALMKYLCTLTKTPIG
ncbi:hypothetical protein LCGC14_2630710, partial [marine sediment metagenome]